MAGNTNKITLNDSPPQATATMTHGRNVYRNLSDLAPFYDKIQNSPHLEAIYAVYTDIYPNCQPKDVHFIRDVIEETHTQFSKSESVRAIVTDVVLMSLRRGNGYLNLVKKILASYVFLQSLLDYTSPPKTWSETERQSDDFYSSIDTLRFTDVENNLISLEDKIDEDRALDAEHDTRIELDEKYTEEWENFLANYGTDNGVPLNNFLQALPNIPNSRINPVDIEDWFNDKRRADFLQRLQKVIPGISDEIIVSYVRNPEGDDADKKLAFIRGLAADVFSYDEENKQVIFNDEVYMDYYKKYINKMSHDGQVGQPDKSAYFSTDELLGAFKDGAKAVFEQLEFPEGGVRIYRKTKKDMEDEQGVIFYKNIDELINGCGEQAYGLDNIIDFALPRTMMDHRDHGVALDPKQEVPLHLAKEYAFMCQTPGDDHTFHAPLKGYGTFNMETARAHVISKFSNSQNYHANDPIDIKEKDANEVIRKKYRNALEYFRLMDHLIPHYDLVREACETLGLTNEDDAITFYIKMLQYTVNRKNPLQARFAIRTLLELINFDLKANNKIIPGNRTDIARTMENHMLDKLLSFDPNDSGVYLLSSEDKNSKEFYARKVLIGKKQIPGFVLVDKANPAKFIFSKTTNRALRKLIRQMHHKRDHQKPLKVDDSIRMKIVLYDPDPKKEQALYKDADANIERALSEFGLHKSKKTVRHKREGIVVEFEKYIVEGSFSGSPQMELQVQCWSNMHSVEFSEIGDHDQYDDDQLRKSEAPALAPQEIFPELYIETPFEPGKHPEFKFIGKDRA